LTVIADAKPVITFVVPTTCFKSITTVELAPSAFVLKISTPSITRVKVAAEDAELVIAILVIIAVVEAGTVYKVALEVANAPRANAVGVFGIYVLLSRLTVRLMLSEFVT
jgi:hypothetical protein